MLTKSISQYTADKALMPETNNLNFIDKEFICPCGKTLGFTTSREQVKKTRLIAQACNDCFNEIVNQDDPIPLQTKKLEHYYQKIHKKIQNNVGFERPEVVTRERNVPEETLNDIKEILLQSNGITVEDISDELGYYRDTIYKAFDKLRQNKEIELKKQKQITDGRSFIYSANHIRLSNNTNF